jgi:hypothetical protein
MTSPENAACRVQWSVRVVGALDCSAAVASPWRGVASAVASVTRGDVQNNVRAMQHHVRQMYRHLPGATT